MKACCIGCNVPSAAAMPSIEITGSLTIAANVLRASSLFYLETGLVSQAPAWWHDGIGVAAFMLSAAITLWLLGRLRDREATPCTT